MGTITHDDGATFRADAAEGTGEWSSWTASPTDETDYYYEGTQCISCQVKKAEIGMYWTDAGTQWDMTTPLALILKIIQTNKNDMDGNGLWLAIGNADTNYWIWYVYPTAADYPVAGGFQIIPIDPNEAGFIGGVVDGGGLDLTLVDFVGIKSDAAAQAKAPNLGMDAIDFLTVGSGWTVIGSAAIFQDFIDADEGEGDANNGRTGLVTTKEGVIYVFGVLTIGTATSVQFADENQVIIFPLGRFGEGFSGIDVNLAHASTVVDWSSIVLKGNGKPSFKQFFDTELQVVGGATDTITLLGHGYETGDYVQYNDEGGTTIGPSDLGWYWVYVVDSDTLALHASRASALADTTRVGLTAAGTGENHSLLRDSDNRFDLEVINNSGTFDLASCTLDGARVITFTDACEMIAGFILNSGKVVPSTGVLTGVNISAATLEEGDVLITPLTDLSNITDCVLDGTDVPGHVIELTAGATHTSNNTYTGFWAPAVDGWKFNAQSGVDSGTDVITTDAAHGLVDGDAVYYNKQGGTVITGLTDLEKYYVNAPSATTLTLHLTKAAAIAGSRIIGITSGSDETHHIYGAHATILNSFGTTTINVSPGSSVPSVRNAGAYEATVVASVDLTINVVDTDGDPIQDAQTSIHLLDSPFTQLMNEDTTAGGIATEGYSGSTPVDVVVKVRKSDNLDDPRYFPFSSVQEISASGLILTVTLEVNPFL